MNEGKIPYDIIKYVSLCDLQIYLMFFPLAFKKVIAKRLYNIYSLSMAKVICIYFSFANLA